MAHRLDSTQTHPHRHTHTHAKAQWNFPIFYKRVISPLMNRMRGKKSIDFVSVFWMDFKLHRKLVEGMQCQWNVELFIDRDSRNIIHVIDVRAKRVCLDMCVCVCELVKTNTKKIKKNKKKRREKIDETKKTHSMPMHLKCNEYLHCRWCIIVMYVWIL